MIAVKLAVSCFIIMSLISTGFYARVQGQISGIDLSIVVSTQKRSYYYREPILFTGDFVQNGQLVSNGTVGVAVYTTGSTPLPIAYKSGKDRNISRELSCRFCGANTL